MARLMERKFRIVILIISTICLSMMLANVLTLNFTIICMTEDHYRWENFTIDLGIDVFERVNFDPKEPSDIPSLPKTPEDRTPSIPGFPDVEIPGIRVPTPGFNWQGFRLARQNPHLFLKLLKTITIEASKLAAERTGEFFDPRNIDFSKFRNGFNFTDINGDIAFRVRNYLVRKVQLARNTYDILDVEGRNISQWRNITVDDIYLETITWNGVIKGQIHILERPADFYYTSGQKATLFSVIAIGALIAIFFISGSIRRFGCRKTFTAISICSAISTALCPAAASAGFFWFVLVRGIQGFGFAACMPVIGAITTSWAKLSENGLFNGALTCFIQLGPFIAMPISGLLCASSLRWPATYYVHAFLTLLFTGIWWLIYRDSPKESNYVLNVELREIEAGKVIDGRLKHNRSNFPFKAICTDPSVWAVWIAAIGNMYSIQTVIFFAPRFINKVLLYPVVGVGFAAAIPTFLQFIVKIIAGISSDRITRLSEKQKLRIYNSIAFCGMAFFFICLALCPVPGPVKGPIPEQVSCWRILALILLIATATILGFNTGGFFKSATLIGREYAYFVNTNVQVIMCIAILTAPYLVFALTPNNEPLGWSCVFILLAVLLIITNGVFCLFCSADAISASKASRTYEISHATEQTKPIIKVQSPSDDTTKTRLSELPADS